MNWHSPVGAKNAMSVDVEDYFQVSAFEHHVSRDDWDGLPRRVERNTDKVLELFRARDVHATFFILGWVAERHPDLVRRIADAGHEIASHGYGHRRVHDLDREAFRADVEATKKILEDLGGQPVRGYRAPSFSLGEKTPWAYDVLIQAGYRYSSSIYPVRHDHYGAPDAPRFAFRPKSGAGLVEVPITTTPLLRRNLPCGGGGYFRLLPYRYSRWGMRRVNARDGAPCIFYFHPWEIDPDQPRVSGVPWRARFRHYTNLGQMGDKLDKLLAAFAWDRIDRVVALDDVGEAAAAAQ